MDEDELSRAERDAHERELLRRIVARGRDADSSFAELFKSYRLPILAFYARTRIIGPKAEDLAQEALLKVWKRAETFRGDSSLASTWIFAIAKNTLLDALRRDKRRPQEEPLPPEPLPNPEPIVSRDDCIKKQFALFCGKYPEPGEAVRRVRLDGWSTRDLALFLGRNEGATRQYLSSSYKKLKEFLAVCRELPEEDQP